MADCAPLLDEELSSFVFSYLTENSGSQYGEEEVCSDRLDTDFPDIDLSQLDTSDFDSVNCLGELQWCNDHPADASPASIHYSTADELFEIEEENAALLAALTDSLDGIVDAEVGGLSVFPALGEEPSQEEEEEDGLSLSAEDFRQPPGAETEDPSLLKKLLLTPPNMPAGVDVHKDGQFVFLLFACLHLQSDIPQERKPRVIRPAGRLCTELHRHLTTAQDTEDTAAPDTEEDEEEEEEEDSESEEEEEEEGEEEEEESSSSEVEGAAVVAAVPAEAAKPQFSSEKELQSVVELITYMHTYCLPTRKQQGWERKDRDLPRPRARPETSRPAATNSHSRVILVPTLGTSGGLTGSSSGAPRRLPFARRREMKADSLLRELLQQSSSFDVSKPYRLHRPPYSHTQSPKNSGSFSVRRSRRLASFPSRFAKRLRPERVREGEAKEEKKEGRAGVKLPPARAGEETTAEMLPGKLTPSNEKPACLCLPLNPKSLVYFYLSPPHSGLTPPTTPPHKSVEDELFKPADGGKGGGGVGGTHHQRKLPEQTELYAQLRRMGQAGDGDARCSFGDHDYCLLSLGESRKRSAAILGAMLQGQGGKTQDFKLHQDPTIPAPPTEHTPLSVNSPTRCTQINTDNCQVFYIHNLPSSVTQNMLRKRFQVFGKAEDCKVIICNEERCGVIKIRSSGVQKHWREREPGFQNGPAGPRRLTRKRYIDLDEAGPGPVKSKYDAMDFDTLLKEAQKSLHR
uniref:Peroxisome proliferator-activated receptor gamma, coactivator 1 beta n=1 Tax=Amphilophus citrinellus TaxID=61819 RepID=A0A3Q0RR84_AMPCI